MRMQSRVGIKDHTHHHTHTPEHLTKRPFILDCGDPLPNNSSLTWSCLLTREGKTSPGQSQRRSVGVRNSVWKCLVWPGVREVLTSWGERESVIIKIDHTASTFFPINPLMMEDLPTLG